MHPIALICTTGFADVLTLGRQNRPDPYALHVGPSPWESLLPAAWRVEVDGRLDATGHEVLPLHLAADGPGTAGTSLDARLAALPHRPAAYAVCLLHGHAHPAHEQRVRDHLRARDPACNVVCSHELTLGPEAGEFEWTRATVEAAGLRGPAPAEASGRAGQERAPAAVAPAPAPAVDPWRSWAQALEALCDEMQATLVSEAVSSVVREAMDCAAVFFLPDGRLAAQARSLPLLLGSLQPAVAGVLAHHPVAQMAPGDGYLSNDPWSGGTHLPDFVLLRPAFVDGRLTGLLATILHHQDVGGITPGSVPTDATSIHHEGLRIPPLRLYRDGAVEPDLLRLLAANSRRPAQLQGDLAAQWTALERGESALATVARRFGNHFDALAAQALAAAEQATRAALSAAPDGEAVWRDALDGDGIDVAPVAVEVRLRKQGAALTIDLRGCAPQTRGPVNASRGAVHAAVTYLAHAIAPQAPRNAGATAALEVLSTPGTVVDPAPGAALNARTNLVKLLANALLGAWSRLLPQQMPAPNAGVAVVLSLSGEAGGTPWVYTEIIASAAGGAPWGPGGSGVSTDVGNARNTPAEVIERQAPLRVEHIGLHHGSGGAGRHAGGCGVERAYRLLRGHGIVSYRGERHTVHAQGGAGGGPGRTGAAWIAYADGRRTELPAKARAPWAAGDLLVIRTAGAGGWGEPEAVAAAAAGDAVAHTDTGGASATAVAGVSPTDRNPV
jgi:N-methylhydantoinase B